MPIAVTCPNGHKLKIKEKYAGQTGLCPHCQARVLVPALNEDAVLDFLGPAPPPPPPEEDPDSMPVYQEPARTGSGASSIMSGTHIHGSSILVRKTKICPKCKHQIAAKFDLCPHCGLYFTNWDEIERRLHLRCPSCSSEYVPGTATCADCGQTLPVESAPTHK
ncbi:MAG: zinc ribbon domain-containing protein [Pirellulaceae bacterium]